MPEPEVTKTDADDAIACLRAITRMAKKSTEFAKSISSKIESNFEDSSNGISFLELKNHVMLNYLMNLNQVMQQKVHGQSLEGSETVQRLIEYRVVLEKMRPIQHKLKYQIEKAINAAKRNQPVDQSLMLRPNVANLMDSDEDDEETKEDKNKMEEETDFNQIKRSDGEKKSKELPVYDPISQSKAYIVPKINPVEYEYEQKERRAKQQERLEKAKKRAASTALVREFTAQFDEEGAPEEVNELNVGQRRVQQQRQEKRQFEEEYLVRLNDKKKKNNEQNNLLTINTLGDNLTHFQNISALNMEDAEEYDELQKAASAAKADGGRNKKKDRPKLPKKVAKKLQQRNAKRAMRKRLRL